MHEIQLAVPEAILASDSVLFLYAQTESNDKCKLLLQDLDDLISDAKFNDLLRTSNESESHPALLMSRPIMPIPSGLTLFEGDGDEKTRDVDKKNAAHLYQSLRTLTPAVARDERLWVSLSLYNFCSYTQKRWGLEESSSTLSTDFRNHIFMASARDAWRDQAFARLWWTGYYANRMSGELSAEQILDVIYLNSELANSFLGRPGLVNDEDVAKVILKCLHKHYLQDQDSQWSRSSFQNFMKALDLIAGGCELAVINPSTLQATVENCFNECHS